jgi:hypothetical protein
LVLSEGGKIKIDMDMDMDTDEQEHTLCSLMNDLNSDSVDRTQEVIEMGRKLNIYIEYYNKFSLEQIEKFLDDISNLFHVYKANLIDVNPFVSYEPNWGRDKYMNPEDFSRNKHIIQCIKTHIMLDKSRYSLHSLLTLARTVFIQIYLFINEDKIKGNLKQVTFYEHELIELNSLMENL